VRADEVAPGATPTVVPDEETEGAPETPADEESDGFIRHARLDDALKWSGAGFAALVAVLGFFGLKEGTLDLDQAFRLYPAATLCVFGLIGVGIVAALFARAVDPKARLRLWALFASLLLMLLIASIFLPDLGDASRNSVTSPDATGRAWEALRPVLAVFLVIATATLLALGWTIPRVPGSKRWGRAKAAALAGAVVSAAGAVWLLLPHRYEPYTRVDLGIDTGRLTSTALTLALVLGLVALTAFVFARRTTFSIMAGLTILAVASTSLGLYGATKVGVESKTLISLPVVDATLDQKDTGDALAINVKAARLRKYRILLEVLGVPHDQAHRATDETTLVTDEKDAVHIWATLLQPDATDGVDKSLNLPIDIHRWKSIKVQYCLIQGGSASDGCDSQEAFVTADIATTAPTSNIEQFNGTIASAENGKLKASFTAYDVRPGMLTRLELCREHVDQTYGRVAHVTLMPDGDGNVTWEMTVSAGKVGESLILRHTACPPGSPCEEAWRELAAYTNEA